MFHYLTVVKSDKFPDVFTWKNRLKDGFSSEKSDVNLIAVINLGAATNHNIALHVNYEWLEYHAMPVSDYTMT